MSRKNEMVQFSAQYPVLAEGGDLAEIAKANIGEGETLSPFDLPRVKVPTGGGLSWMVQAIDGEQAVKKITGIIVAWGDVRAYWPESFGSSVPPACSSTDNKTGEGEPGGSCRTCPHAQWGSAVNAAGVSTRGQACKSMRRLIVLQPESALPISVTLPPTSIKPCRMYFARLLSAKAPYWGAVTEITLEKATSRDGVDYARATFAVASVDGEPALLAPEDAESVRRYGEMFCGAVSAPVEHDEYVSAEE
ncbi:MAG: hypothetical protein ABII76_00445 [Pseudomonadota bacterium]